MRNGLIVEDGTQRWYLDDKLHRDNGLPAVITANGHQEWFRHGQCHRENGPAIIRANSSQQWYLNGKCHRENGPAIITADGYYQAWYLSDNQIDVEKWIKDNDITTSWELWDDVTWSLFCLEFL